MFLYLILHTLNGKKRCTGYYQWKKDVNIMI